MKYNISMATYKLLIQAVTGGTIYTSPVLSNAPAVYAASRREIRQFTTTDFVLDQLPNTYKIDFNWDICPLDWARQMLYLDKNIEYRLTWIGSDKKTKTIVRAKIYLTVIPNAQYIDKRSLKIIAKVLEFTSSLPIPQPKAWYRAESIRTVADGDLVSSWADISGNNYDLTIASWSASNVANFRAGVINSKAAVELIGYRAFDGQKRGYQMANDGFLLQQMTYFAVMNVIDTSSAGIIGADQVGGSATYQGTEIESYADSIIVKSRDNVEVTPVISIPNQNTWHVLRVTKDMGSGDYEIAKNGTVLASSNYRPGQNIIVPTKYVGRFNGDTGNNNLTALFAEKIIYDTVLSSDSNTQVENYLLGEYLS